tara:strand:+ start:89 stop:334 length:246 start_codon:yes stop_codon:yes gene_type:complete
MNELKILQALEEVNYKIDDIQSMLEVIEPTNTFEEEAVEAFTNVLGRYRVIKTSLENSLKKAGGGTTDSCLNGKCAADSMW